MNAIPTAGRRPTLEETLAYYNRDDVAAALFEATRRWLVAFVMPTQSRWEPDWKRDRLSPNSPREMAETMTARILASAPRFSASERLPFYPSLHRQLIRYAVDRVGEEAEILGRDLFWEADAVNWRDSFDAVFSLLDVLTDCGARFRVKYSGNRSLHLTVAAPRSLERSMGLAPNELQRRVSLAMDRCLRDEGGTRPHSPSLIRLEYSLNEDAGFVSLPISPDRLAEFSPWEANLHSVEVRVEAIADWPDRNEGIEKLLSLDPANQPDGALEPSPRSPSPNPRFATRIGSSVSSRIRMRREADPNLRERIEASGGYRSWTVDEYDRARGLWTILSDSDRADAEFLAEVLQGEESEPRWVAVHFADDLSPSQRVPLLLESIGRDALINGTILDQFRRMGRAATAPLLEIVESEPDLKIAFWSRRPSALSAKASAGRKALSLLQRSAFAMTAEDALADLSSGHAILQARAALTLGGCGDARHVTFLAMAAERSSEPVRRALLDALATLAERDPRGVISELRLLARTNESASLRPLARICVEGNESIRRETVESLRSIYGNRTTEAVETLLDPSESPSIRAGATRIWADMRGAAASDRLARIAKGDASDEARCAALEALVRLNPERGLNLARELIRSTRKTLRLKAAAIYEEGRRRIAIPGSDGEDEPSPTPDPPLLLLRDPEAPGLAAKSPRETDIERAMRQGLELASADPERWPKMLRKLADLERQASWILAYSLDRLSERSPEDAEERIEMLSAHKDETLRAIVARALGLRELGDSTAALARLNKLAGDPRPSVRASVAEGIGEIEGAEEARFQLLEALSRDKNPEVRRGAAKGLSGCGRRSPTRALRILRDLVLDADERVQGSAVTAIQRIGSVQPRAVLAQFERWAEESDLEEIVAACLSSLADALGGECVPLMERLARSRDARTRWSMAAWIGQTEFFPDGPNEAIAERVRSLLAALAEDRDHAVRSQLARSLGRSEGGNSIGFPRSYPLESLKVLSCLWDDDRESVANLAESSARVIDRCGGPDISLWAFRRGR